MIVVSLYPVVSKNIEYSIAFINMRFGPVSNSYYVGLIDRLHSSNYEGPRRCSRVGAARNGSGGNLQTGGGLLEINNGTTCKSHLDYDYAATLCLGCVSTFFLEVLMARPMY